MKNPTLAFVYPPEIDQLKYPDDCPFKTNRAGLARQRLHSLGLLGTIGREEVTCKQATLAELTQFHSAAYVAELERASRGDLTLQGLEMGLGGPDTPAFRDMFSYGAWACGASLHAADLLLAGKYDIAFSLIGGFHHAMADKASGFCYLNDVVLACQRLAQAGKRVVYLDIDAHHGDGVQEAFYRRKDVLTVSLHESGDTLFPWGGFESETGEGDGLGFNVNVPLPAETYDQAFLAAFDQVVVPLLNGYRSDIIVLELGMDTLAGDPLTHLKMTNNVVVEVLQRILPLGKPLLVSGGGGYHVANTARAWALAWKTCCGDLDDDAVSLGLGGVLLGSSEWAGGLRDPELPVAPMQRRAIELELGRTVDAVGNLVFPHHHLDSTGRLPKFPVSSSA